MKKLSLLLAFCFTTVLAFPQQTVKVEGPISLKFQKNNFVVASGSGLGIYRTHIKELPNGTIESDTTGTVPYFLSFEYFPINRLSGGLQFGYNHFIQGDSAHGQTAKGIDLMLRCNFHFLTTKHIDMLIGPDFGYSHFGIKNNDLNNSGARGGGTVYGINFESRFYFGKGNRFGIFINVGYQNRTYPKGGFYDDTGTHYSDFWLKLHGTNFGGGLVFRTET